MKVALLSDTRLPTNLSFPGHGLGKLALAIASGLKKRGHEVTLFGGKGSAWEGSTLVFENEIEYAQASFTYYDAILDITHQHLLQRQPITPPIINISVDREGFPGKNAIFPSEAHRQFHRYAAAQARIIPHGVDIPEIDEPKRGNYFAYLSMFFPQKGPLMAAEAARLAGVELIMAGPTPPAPPAGVKYIGPLEGADKYKFLAQAKALLYPASTESGGLVPLEAQSVGTPALVSAYGGAKEQILEGVTGFAARDTLEMVEAIKKVDTLDRAKVKQWIVDCRQTSTMIDAYERALTDVVSGGTW